MDTETNRLTKTPVTMKAVYDEFRDSIAKKHGIETFRSKSVTKNFAFSVPDVNVPMTCDYLEVCSSKYFCFHSKTHKPICRSVMTVERSRST